MNKDQLAAELSKQFADQGKIIEAGWVGLRALSVPDSAPDIQVREMRGAFFAGAQHLFASIMTILDPEGEEPTENDMRRMSLIHAELQAYLAEFKREHGLA